MNLIAMATDSKIILQTLKAWVIGFDFDCGIKSQSVSTPKKMIDVQIGLLISHPHEGGLWPIAV